jgi:hypothetical protein
MSISEAFDGVIPARPVSPAAPRPTPPAKVVRIHPQAAPAVRRPSRVTRLVRVVHTDAADSWIAEEQSPSAKTVWHTDHTAHLDRPWKPYRMWATCYRVPAVLFTLLLDAVKYLLLHPLRAPLTVSAAALVYLLATH